MVVIGAGGHGLATAYFLAKKYGARRARASLACRCTGASEFELLVTQSYTDYLLGWLEEATLEFSGADS